MNQPVLAAASLACGTYDVLDQPSPAVRLSGGGGKGGGAGGPTCRGPICAAIGACGSNPFFGVCGTYENAVDIGTPCRLPDGTQGRWCKCCQQ